MIDTEVIISEFAPEPLCRTFSTENKKLKKVQDSIIYGASVIDIIAGYNSEAKPYSNFIYEETAETEETEEEYYD